MSNPDFPGNHSSLVDPQARHLPSRGLHAARSWLFVPGLDRSAQQRGLASGAGVLVADLDERTLPRDRPAACIRVVDLMAECRQAGAVAAVRINRLEQGGRQELEKAMEGAPDAVLISETETAAPIEALDALLQDCESRLGLPAGRTAIVPVLASPLAIVRTFDVLSASPRIKAALLSGRALARALGMHSPDDTEALRHARSRFALECAAAGCLAVDSGHAYPHAEALAEDLAWARRQGFKAKQALSEDQAAALNQALSCQGDPA